MRGAYCTQTTVTSLLQPKDPGRLGRTLIAGHERFGAVEIRGRLDAMSERGLHLAGVEVGHAGLRIDADGVFQQLHRRRRGRVAEAIPAPGCLGGVRSVLRVALRRELER